MPPRAGASSRLLLLAGPQRALVSRSLATDAAAAAAARPDDVAPPDSEMHAILSDTRTIAMIGASPNWKRPSYFAMSYMQNKGYRVIPVNPVAVGENILGEEASQQQPNESRRCVFFRRLFFLFGLGQRHERRTAARRDDELEET